MYVLGFLVAALPLSVNTQAYDYRTLSNELDLKVFLRFLIISFIKVYSIMPGPRSVDFLGILVLSGLWRERDPLCCHL